ncbi:MAG: hypothetical protein HUJ63_07490, partial [Enterococcus sp.]|nr:hypothetical protein [Enterococcus sp.]
MLSACHTGSGKTYLAAQTIRDLGMKTLVVCPKVAITQWRNVLKGMGADGLVVGVVNPEHLVASRNDPFYDNDSGWKTDARLLVFDEVHRGASGPKSKTTLALARWCGKARPDAKALLMSATPFDTPEKMRAVGYLMGMHRFVPGSWYEFLRSNGCRTVERGGRSVLEFTRNRREAEAIMRSLRERMGERFMSIGPKDIPGFPDEVKEVVSVDLGLADAAALAKAYDEMPERIVRPSKDDMVRILRLRQQAEFCKAGVIAQMAADEVADGNSVFVMVNFTDARKRVETFLAEKGVAFASIYGGQPESERQRGIDDFQANRVFVMVGMAAACSVALSLHDERGERTRVSLISPGYSASEFSQGLGRIRRVGGTTAVQKIVIAANSV